MTRPFASAALTLCMLAATLTPLEATDLAVPTGEVILIVSGAITVTNGGGVASFDRAMLERLPQHSFATATIWTAGTNTYGGILLRDLLVAVGATGTTVRATALNDYQISFPAQDVAADAPLVAYLSDGKPMSVRDKGPLWLIYPFDTNPDYRTEQNYVRSVWQLHRIEIEN